ncbi:hypothetical protein Hanom_Chr09g00860501 [Helianthus anomalus]
MMMESFFKVLRERVQLDITLTDGWKTIVDDLGLKHGFLLDFTPFESYAEFMLTAFNVDFVIVFKSRKRHLTFQLLEMIHQAPEVGSLPSGMVIFFYLNCCIHIFLFKYYSFICCFFYRNRSMIMRRLFDCKLLWIFVALFMIYFHNFTKKASFSRFRFK